MGSVRDYYERNTRGFLRLGRGSRTGAIHRALWRPGTRTVHEAMHTIHDLLADAFVAHGIGVRVSEREAPTASPADEWAGAIAREPAEFTTDDRAGAAAEDLRPHLLDLGCGVGASMRAIESRLHVRTTGITISPVQAEIARAMDAPRATEGSRAVRAPRVIVGDFTSPETLDAARGAAPLDGAWMIESWVHAPDGAMLLRELAARMRPGALLAICDDFPAYEDRAVLAPREQRWADEFVTGWHVRTWVTPRQLDDLAATAGLEARGGADLSEWVAVDRPRDYLVRLVAGPARRLALSTPWWSNIRGGNALQQLGKRRLIRYQLRLFARKPLPESAPPPPSSAPS